MKLKPDDPNFKQLSALCDKMAAAIAKGNASAQQAIDSNEADFTAICIAAKAISSGGLGSPKGPSAVLNQAINISSAGGGGGPPPTFLGHTPKTNPYLTPGIMARLGPILSELAKIYTNMIKQSSQLKQNMMDVMMSMAKEAYNCSIAAGQAKVAAFQQDINDAIANIVSGAISIGMTLGQAGFQAAKMSRFDKANKEPFETDIKSRFANTVRDRPTDDMREKSPQKYLSHNEYNSYTKNGKLDDAKVDRAYEFSDKRMRERTQIENEGKSFTATKDFIGTCIQNGTKIFTSTERQKAAMDQAMAEGMEKLLSQVLQIVMDTMRTASETGQTAEKDWQSFNQLFKDMATSVTQAIYR
jgi:hypothetical protein